MECFCNLKEDLLRRCGSNRWCVFCKGKLVGLFTSLEEANLSGNNAAKQEGTDIFLVAELSDAPVAESLCLSLRCADGLGETGA